MGAHDTARTAARPGGSVLLAANDEPWRACRTYLGEVEANADALLGVLVDRDSAAFLADWRDWMDSTRDLAVLDVGSESRSATATTPESAARAAVRAVGTDELEDLPVMVRTYVEEWAEADRRVVVYVEGVAGLVPALGLDRLVPVVDGVLEQVEATGARCYVTASRGHPDATAVLTPLFDDVLDIEATADGAYRATSRERPALPLDLLFELLKPERRRRALRYVSRVDDTTIEDLASYLVSTDRTAGAVDSGDEQRVRIGLYQFDLPKLADAGVVEFDPDAGTVAATDRLDELRPYLALAAHHGVAE